MLSTAAPSRTMRPRKSRALTANGRIVSSTASAAGGRTGMPIWGSFIATEYRRGRPIWEPFRRLRRAISRETPGQYALLRMQPVLRFVEHHRLRAVDHLVGNLFAAMRGQAMHKDGARLGARHQSGIDLIALEQIVAAGAVSIAHGDPGIGHHAVGALDGLLRV